MRAALIAAALLIPAMAEAQTVRAQTGEHAGFTRLVLDLPRPAAWKLGRTADGYEIDVAGDGLRFDLADVFRVIPRTRLATIWADPETGTLRLGLACSCHAVAFEHRPDILVIDLRDGPPEPGSKAELALDGQPMPTLIAAPPSRLRPRPAPNRPRPEARPDRLALVRPLSRPFDPARPGSLSGASAPPPPDFRAAVQNARRAPAPALPFDFPEAAPPIAGLDALRSELLEGLGRAATAGVIDVDRPIFPDPPLPSPRVPGGPLAHLAIDTLPGLAASPVNAPDATLTARGDRCIADADLAISTWADGRPFDAQMSAAQTGLVGEFDRPDAEKVAALVRLMLHFGFGAEARSVLAAFPLDDAAAPLWLAVSHIVDGDRPPLPGPLAGQATCHGPSALWAVLARPDDATLRMVDRPSVAAAFSALPVHLRRLLGSGLAESFLVAGDANAAQTLRDAIWRAPGDPGPAAKLADAQLDRARGRLSQAKDTLSEVVDQTGPAAVQALVALIDTELALGEVPDAGTITNLAALVHENRGQAIEPALIRAEILARGASGDFETAFALADRQPAAVSAELWQLLAVSGSDSALLSQAILPADAAPATVGPEIARRLAGRLLALGFPDDTLRWLPDPGDAGDRLLRAGAELQKGDARATLRLLAGETGAEADRLRAEALTRLGDPSAAAQAFASAGDSDAAAVALRHAGDWTAGAASAPEPVQTALAVLVPPAAPPTADAGAPLAQGRALLAQSAQARDAITALLQASPAPENTGP